MPAVKDPDPNEQDQRHTVRESISDQPELIQLLSMCGTQPNHGPGHVREKEELRVGEKYQIIDAQKSVEVRIFCIPSKRIEKADRYIDVIYAIRGAENRIFSISLADYGVIQYPDGKWHPNNRIMRPSMES